MCEPATPDAGLDWRIVGIGSFLNSDDEIGLALVRALAHEAGWGSCCVLWEGADAASVASSLLEWGKPVILADAADMSLPAGEYRFFPDLDASLLLKNDAVSTHGLSFAEGLQLARILGFDLPVFIFAVQPFDLSPGQGLTPEMTVLFPALLSALKLACEKVTGGR